MSKISCSIVTPKIEELAKQLGKKPDLVNQYISSWQTSTGKTTTIPDLEELKSFIAKDRQLREEEINNKTLIKDSYNQFIKVNNDDYAKFVQSFTPQTLQNREDLIASLFTEIIDENIETQEEKWLDELNTLADSKKDIKRKITLSRNIGMLKDPVKGRQLVIESLGIDTILNEVKNFITEAKDAEEDPYRKGEYQKIEDYFYYLIEGACNTIEARENVRIIIDKDNLSNTKVTNSVSEKEHIDQIYDDNSEGEEVNGNLGWAFRIKFVDPLSSLTSKVKKLLNSIPLRDKNRRIIKDDLGYYKYLDGNTAYITLLNELEYITRPEQFNIVTDDEIRFPALEKIEGKYYWIKDFSNILKNKYDEGDNVINEFYYVIRKDFVQSMMLTYNNGKLVYIPINAPVVSETITDAVQRNITNGYLLSENAIYNNNGLINKDNVKNLIAKIKDINSELTDDELIDSSLVGSIEEVFKSIGYDPQHLRIKDIAPEDTKKAINIVLQLLNDVDKVKEKDIEKYNIYNAQSSRYKAIAHLIGIVDTLHNSISYRQGKETYQNYQAPCYIHTLIKEIKNDDYREEVLDRYKASKFFYNNGKFRNIWLDYLSRDDAEGAYVRNNLETDELQFIKTGKDAKEYKEWTPKEIEEAFVGRFFSVNYDSDPNRIKFAYYHFPIFSDSTTAKFIKFVKLSDENEIIDNLVQVARQELSRIKVVQSRREKVSTGEISELAGYDKYGTKFCFMPFLNTQKIEGDPQFKDLTILEAIKVIKSSNNTKNANEIINNLLKGLISNYLSAEFKGFYSNFPVNGKIVDILKNYGYPLSPSKDAESRQKDIENYLKNYFYNSYLAQSQIIQLFASDLALYGSADKFQKRFKEVLASGNKLNTKSKYGKDVETNIYLKDFYEASTVFTEIKAQVEKMINDGEVSRKEGNRILDTFLSMCGTDGQALRTLKSYRSIADMMGMWSDSQEEAFERYESGEFSVEDFNTFNQTVKGFLYSMIPQDDGVGGKILVGHQHKNSEFILLAKYPKIASVLQNNPVLKGLHEFMDDNNIDVAQFESAVKVGASNLIDLRYDPKKFNSYKIRESIDLTTDYDSFIEDLNRKLKNEKITQNEYNNIIKEVSFSDSQEVKDLLQETTKKAGYIHKLPYNDFMHTTPTPEHLFDVEESTLGSQFLNLMVSDMPQNMTVQVYDHTYTSDEIYNMWEDIRVERMLDGYKNAINVFDSIETLQARLLEMIKGNPKYSRDMISALDIITDERGNKTFRTALYSPLIRPLVEDLTSSIFKNSVTKQKMKGGAAILASTVGSKDLKVEFNKDGGIEYVEAYLPAYSKKFIEPLLKEITDNNGNSYYVLDIDKLDEDLKNFIGYRIPSEDKYSIWNIRIKGFLPQQNGSAVMLPSELVNCAGWDFDVDKLFVLLPSFYFDKKENKYKKHKYKSDARLTSDDVKAMTAKERDNLLLDIASAILQHKNTAQKALNPGNFESYKEVGRKLNVLKNWNLWNKWSKGRKTPIKDLLDSDLRTVDKFIKDNSETIDPLLLSTFSFFHKQNMAGLDLIAINAVNSVLHAKSTHTNLELKFPNNIAPIIEGENLGNLHRMYNSKGDRISKNVSSGIGAAADNAKDPSLAAMNLNPNSAGFGNGLFRLGLSPMTLGLLFSLPTVEFSINNGGKVNSLWNSLSHELKNSFNIDPVGVIEEYNKKGGITNDMLVKAILNNKKVVLALVDKPDEESVPEYFKRIGGEVLDLYLEERKLSLVLAYIAQSYTAIEQLARISKSDSKNNAIDITIAGAENQVSLVKGVQNYYDYDARSINLDSHNVQGIKSFNTNIELTNVKSAEKVREDLFKSFRYPNKLKGLQASYTLGIQAPLAVLSEYFLNSTPAVRKGIDEIRFNSGKSTLYKKAFNDYYYGITTYVLAAETKMFGENYMEKRKYYIEEFPSKFMSFIQQPENSDIKNLSAISKLSNRYGKLVYSKSGRLNAILREHLRKDLEYLLYMSNPNAQKVAYDLVMYSYFAESMRFGPNSYSNLFSTRFLEAFPEINSTLRKLPYLLEDPSYLDVYNRLFTIQNGDRILAKVVGEYDSESNTIRVSLDDPNIYNPYMETYEGTNNRIINTVLTTIKKGEKSINVIASDPVVISNDYVVYNDIVEMNQYPNPIYWPNATLEDLNASLAPKTTGANFDDIPYIDESAFQSVPDIVEPDYDFDSIPSFNSPTETDFDSIPGIDERVLDALNDIPEPGDIIDNYQEIEYPMEEASEEAQLLCPPLND